MQNDLLITLINSGNKKAHTTSRSGVIKEAMKDFIASFDTNIEVRNKYLQKIADIEQDNQPKNIIIKKETYPLQQTNVKNDVNINKLRKKDISTMYNQIKPGEKGLTGTEVNKISGATIFQGMNFGKRVIMMGKNYNDFENNIDDNIIYYEGHNVRRNETNQDPFYINQSRTHENAKFCDAVDAYKKGKEPAYIHVFHNLSPNNWEYKGIYALIDYEYIDSRGRMVYRFKLKRHDF